jgi:glycosyltransferase involved in cell wall biosynthesis
VRILYYNWVDYLDDEGRGGGVSVYQRNLLAAIDAQPGIEAAFLSSGLSFDLPPGAPRWEPVRHGPLRDRERRYEIVNSGAQSPAHHSFGAPGQVSHPATEAVLCDFIATTGPYDVMHLNNLEGLPAAALGALRARFPAMRLVLTLHNYYPFCPQVNLWHQERETCGDFDAGRACVNCLPVRHDPRHLRLAGGLAYRLKRAGIQPGSRAFEVIFRWSMRAGRYAARTLGWLRGRRAALRQTRGAPGELVALMRPDGAPFEARRAAMVAAINGACDRVLCVSDAVRILAVSHGIEPELAHTSYIGTVEAEAFGRTAPRPVPQAADGTLTLAYLGYMRRDKGFHFLLGALEALPAATASRLRLVIAARRGDKVTMSRIAALSAHLAEVDYADGYGHDDLDRLLAPVDVGLIPVMWHDNLPQVAIEMHARHIPLLCADMGGARELAGCPQMVFRAGDPEAFRAGIEKVLNGGVDFAAYWRGAMAPVDMARHLEELKIHYRPEGH